MTFSETDMARLWSNVDKSAGPDGCWPYLALLTDGGYGRIKFKGRFYGAHRVTLSQATGVPIDCDEMALHSCDYRRCVNPAHLRWGTNTDNMRDMVSRGRAVDWAGRREGAKNPNAKLTEDDVRNIRASALRTPEMAANYGVSEWAINAIKARRTWRNVA
jgi:hypothetical protein